MFRVDAKGNIAGPRGDSGIIPVYISNYKIQNDDKLTFTVRKNTEQNSEILIQKISKGSNTIIILPEDTEKLEYGSYPYDVELRTANGDVTTFCRKMIITEEVTY